MQQAVGRFHHTMQDRKSASCGLCLPFVAVIVTVENDARMLGNELGCDLAGSFLTSLRGCIFARKKGFQPVSAFNYGAKKYSRLRKEFLFACLVSEGIIIVSCTSLIVFSGSLIGLFRDDAKVIEI